MLPFPLRYAAGEVRPRTGGGSLEAASPVVQRPPRVALSSDPPPGRGRPTSPARGEGPMGYRCGRATCAALPGVIVTLGPGLSRTTLSEPRSDFAEAVVPESDHVTVNWSCATPGCFCQ